MLIGTWNEKDNPDLPAAQVREDARRVAKRFRGPAVIGGQEFGETADHRAIDLAFGTIRWQQLYRGQATPIIFNAWRFKVLDLGYVQTHKGVAHVTPHRGFAWAKIRHRWRQRLAPFYFYNTHLVSKPATSAQRASFYETHIDKMRTHIATKAPDGLDIFVVGDFNKKTAPQLHPDQHELESHWLDHILWIPGHRGNQVRVDHRIRMTGPLHTDHDPIAVVLELNPKGGTR